MERLKIRLVGSSILAVTIMLLSQAPPAHATFPGTNGRILFGRFDYPDVGAYDLFTANPDGTHVVQVTHVPSYCTEWSPDGSRIAFTFIEPDGSTEIATMDPDGSKIKVLAEGECPSWSPDGSKLVFDTVVDPNAPEFFTTLMVMNANGTDPHPLIAPSLQGFDVEPRWQPTEHLIAFVRIRKYQPPNGVQQEAVFVVGAGGTRVRQLTSWGLAPEHPTWSPDGRQIVFNDASFKPGAHETIWVMRPDGTDRHVVYQGTSNTGGVKPQFSPDGSKILFSCITYGSAFGNGHSEDLCTINVDGTGLVDITNTPGIDENLPSWGTSPLL